MYNPPAFRIDDRDEALDLMTRHNFATLISGDADDLQVSHLPMVVRRSKGGLPTLFAHVARANPHWRQFDGKREALIIFQGPHGYVSPSLYEAHPSVPTWNYQVVHAYGAPNLLDRDESRAHVLELVEQQESGRSEPWRPDLPDDFFSALLVQIVAFRIEVERIETKFKLGQNRPIVDRKSMATTFEASEDAALRALGASIRRSLDTGKSG